MDVKSLSAILGHVSAATTLNIYAHVTDTMQAEAAAKIDRGLGNLEVHEISPERDKPECHRQRGRGEPAHGGETL